MRIRVKSSVIDSDHNRNAHPVVEPSTSSKENPPTKQVSPTGSTLAAKTISDNRSNLNQTKGSNISSIHLSLSEDSDYESVGIILSELGKDENFFKTPPSKSDMMEGSINFMEISSSPANCSGKKPELSNTLDYQQEEPELISIEEQREENAKKILEGMDQSSPEMVDSEIDNDNVMRSPDTVKEAVPVRQAGTKDLKKLLDGLGKVTPLTDSSQASTSSSETALQGKPGIKDLKKVKQYCLKAQGPDGNNDKAGTPEAASSDDVISVGSTEVAAAQPIQEGKDDKSQSENGHLSAIELQRKRNMERIAAAMEELKDPVMEAELERTSKYLFSCEEPPKKVMRKRKRSEEASVRFRVKIPTGERRRSSRLQHQTPEFSSHDLDVIQGNIREMFYPHSYTSRVKHVVGDGSPERNRARSKGNKYLIPVDDVTPEMLDNVIINFGDKVLSSEGTTCHQCRQKTLDQKTSCRNPECRGWQGVFCGPCLKIRYGEDCTEALVNANWICPPCRGRCNCSICRTREGKRPTGILYFMAVNAGYKSVDHYLAALNGEGDKPWQDQEWALRRDPEALLGFSDNGRKAHFNSHTELLDCPSCQLKDWYEEENLLGFTSDGLSAVMGSKKIERLVRLLE